jgi:hypothetical protein
MEEVEISHIDTSFERIRIRDRAVEKALLDSIIESGIRESLKCAGSHHGRLILLDGFKRLRCALKLGIKAVPVVSLGDDEATAILRLLRISTAKTLSTLEQAALVDELHQAHRMTVTQIANHLERSPAWVSLRIGLIGEMSETVKEEIFTGRFPLRSYMYTLRSFTRVKGIRKSEIALFVKSVSGKGLSIRALDVLAHSFFEGGPEMREQIAHGSINWTLNQLTQQPERAPSSFNEWESKALSGLEQAQGCIIRVPRQLKDGRLKSSEFFSEADLLTEGILKGMDFFITTLRWFYDRRREKKSGSCTLQGREEEERDSPASQSHAQDSAKNTG